MLWKFKKGKVYHIDEFYHILAFAQNDSVMIPTDMNGNKIEFPEGGSDWWKCTKSFSVKVKLNIYKSNKN